MFQSYVLKTYLLFMVLMLPAVGFGQTATVVPPIPTVVPKAATVVKPVTIAAPVVIPPPEVSTPTSVPQPTQNWSLRPMTEDEFTSSMCVLGATAGLALTYMVGPNEIIMLVVGGVVVPSSPSVLFVSLFGTMAAAGCTIGGASTPAISWLYQRYADSK